MVVYMYKVHELFISDIIKNTYFHRTILPEWVYTRHLVELVGLVTDKLGNGSLSRCVVPSKLNLWSEMNS
jgi:hypothetical protein